MLGWSLGANDSANVFGPGVATGAVGYRAAVLLTSLFVMAGAIAEGPKCMRTVGELSRLAPMEAFICALCAGATLAILTGLGLPASASQAIVGAVVGAGISSGLLELDKLFRIVSCWILTPISAALAAYMLHRLLGLAIEKAVGTLFNRNRIYLAGIVVSGCYSAYGLGGNNVANVTGVYVGSGMLTADTAALIGGLSIAAGVLTYGKKVMMTVGKGIVPLDPFSGFVVMLAQGVALHLFTQIGVPVSSTQAVVGAVVGVGLVGNARTINFRNLGRIGAGWVITPLCPGVMTWLALGLFL